MKGRRCCRELTSVIALVNPRHTLLYGKNALSGDLLIPVTLGAVSLYPINIAFNHAGTVGGFSFRKKNIFVNSIV